MDFRDVLAVSKKVNDLYSANILKRIRRIGGRVTWGGKG